MTRLSRSPNSRKPHDDRPLVLFARVSTRSQDIIGQIDRLLFTVGEERVVAVFSAVCRGADVLTHPTFKAAITAAQEAGAVLVIESVSRLVRHPDYRPGASGKQPEPTADQIADLENLLGEIPILEIGSRPDYRRKEFIESIVRKMNRRRRKKIGRPNKKNLVRRAEKIVEQGESISSACEFFNISRPTYYRWSQTR